MANPDHVNAITNYFLSLLNEVELFRQNNQNLLWCRGGEPDIKQPRILTALTRTNYNNLRRSLVLGLGELKLVECLVVAMAAGPVSFAQDGGFDFSLEEIH
jgi:hypothetical protein